MASFPPECRPQRERSATKKSGKSCTTSGTCPREGVWEIRSCMAECRLGSEERLRKPSDCRRMVHSSGIRQVAKTLNKRAFDRVTHHVLVIVSQKRSKAVGVHDAFSHHVRRDLRRDGGKASPPGELQRRFAGPFPGNADEF